MYESDTESLSRLMDGEWTDLDPSRCAATVCQSAELQAKWARYHLIRDALHNETVSYDADLAARVRQAIADEPTYSNVASLAGAGVSTLAESSGPSDAGASRLLPMVAGPDLTHAVVPVTAGLPTSGSTGRGRVVGALALVASTALVTVVGLDVWQGGVSAPSADVAQVARNVTPAMTADVGAGDATTLAPVVASSSMRILPTNNLPEVELVANRGSHWITAGAQRQAATEERLNLFLSQHIEHSPTADRTGMLPYSRLVGYDEVSD